MTLTPSEAPQVEVYISTDPAHWTPAQRTRNERMSAFLRALQEEGFILRACEVSGVSEPTTWRWRKDHPQFAEAVDQILTQGRQTRIEENMFRIATSTDPKMANATVKAGEFMLRALDPNRYSERHKIESTVTINQQMQVAHQVLQEFRARQAERIANLQARTLDAPPITSDVEQG